MASGLTTNYLLLQLKLVVVFDVGLVTVALEFEVNSKLANGGSLISEYCRAIPSFLYIFIPLLSVLYVRKTSRILIEIVRENSGMVRLKKVPAMLPTRTIGIITLATE